MNGIENNNIAFQQWKTCVQLANDVSKRRDTLNNLFVVVTLGLFTVMFNMNDYFLCLAILLLLVFVIWFTLILYYRNLNKAKYKVIVMLEKQFVVKPISEEWDYYKNSKCSFDSTFVELFIPVILFVFNIAVIICHYNLGG